MLNFIENTPSPPLPSRGRVPAGALDHIAPQPQIGTSPLEGEVGRGVSNHTKAVGKRTENI